MSIDIENAYLSVLLNWWEELMWITEENFKNEENRKLFKAISHLLSKWSPVDIVTVKDRLNDTWEELDNKFIISIADTPAHESSMAYYSNRMKKESRRSEVAKIAANMLSSAENSSIESWEIIGFADKLLSLNNLDSSEYSLDSIIEDTMWYIESRFWKKLFWWSFGSQFEFLDKYTKWIQKWRTYRIGAVSNLWKSQFAYNVIVSLLEQWAKVAFFTLENEKSFTVTNILANKEQVNSHSVVDWSCSVDFWWLERYKSSFYLVDEEYELSRIFARILEIKPDVVVLDYIWLININKIKEDEMYTQYARRVQAFVKSSWISMIDLSNLPKEADEDNIRLYGWFFWSSFLRNNTDVGLHLFYYKPFYEWRSKSGLKMDDKMKNIQVVTMLISKNRIWTAKVEQVYKVDFNKWGMFSPATGQELSLWNF